MPLLEMQNITKHYPGVVALQDVYFSLDAGEVHCLLGENGAGKSTLMKILSGATEKHSGNVILDGKPISIDSPSAAQQLGISTIYQDFNLVPELSVAENVLLGNESVSSRLRLLDFEAMHRRAQTLLQQLGEEIDTSEPLRNLSTAQRQIVAIAKALSRNVRILVMDEPTGSLTGRESANLFSVIRRLKGDGVGIIYISHRLEEVFTIGDRITVLRDGKNVGTYKVADVNRPMLIRSMVGREPENEFPPIELHRGSEFLRVEHVCTPLLQNVSFSLHRGEILGLAGLVGAGRTELARVLFGADPKTTGTVYLEGKEIHLRSPDQAIAAGIGLLTEDRNRQGLFLQMNVRENISISNLKDVSSGPFLRQSDEQLVATRFTDQLHIKPQATEAIVETLSGGNRQKVVLARWLFTNSKVLIFDEPTVGIDVGVKYDIYQLIHRLARSGVGVIIISSDTVELLGICTRIAVMCNGRITGILSQEEATQERILELATSFGEKSS